VALDALAHNGFEVLVLCAEEWQPSSEHFPGVEVIYAPFDDDHSGPLPPRQQRIAFDAAQKTAQALTAGKKTLVTCWAGRNRSGLVSALALASVSGEHPAAAGDMIRDVRDGALTNMQFLSLLSRAQLKKTCELCEAKPITQRYHEDALCWIADCAQCGVPMAVYREHGTMPPPEHLDHMLETLKRCGRPRRGGHRFDDSMNTIPDHYHVHLRPA
jgi:protein-tyrosine phosphatase